MKELRKLVREFEKDLKEIDEFLENSQNQIRSLTTVISECRDTIEQSTERRREILRKLDERISVKADLESRLLKLKAVLDGTDA